MNIQNPYKTAAALMVTTIVLFFSGCEKTEETPDNPNDGDNGNKESVFLNIHERTILNASFGTNESEKTFEGWSVPNPAIYTSVNPPVEKSNCEMNVTITIPSKRNIDYLEYDSKNKTYPPTEMFGYTNIILRSNHSDSILFDVEGYKNFHVSTIEYNGSKGFINTITAYDVKIRPGDTYYSYYSNKLYHLSRFFAENAKSFKMEVYDDNGFVKNCTNIHIPHIITGTGDEVSTDSLKAASKAISSNYGYFDNSKIVIQAVFDKARVDTIFTKLTPWDLEPYGVKTDKNANLLVH